MEFSHGHLETFIKVIISQTKGTVLDRCIGAMGVSIREIGIKVFSMEKVKNTIT